MKRLGSALVAALCLVAAVLCFLPTETRKADAGAVTAPTGPLEPSQLQSIVNQIVASVNAQVNGLLGNFLYDSGTLAATTPLALYVYTLPANTLSANGQGVRVVCFGDFSPNTNNKTVAFVIGVSPSVTIHISSGVVAYNNSSWRATLNVIRVGAASSSIYGDFIIGTTPNQSGTAANAGISAYVLSNATLSFASDFAIGCTGQNGTATANDVRGRGMIVEQIK